MIRFENDYTEGAHKRILKRIKTVIYPWQILQGFVMCSISGERKLGHCLGKQQSS